MAAWLGLWDFTLLETAQHILLMKLCQADKTMVFLLLMGAERRRRQNVAGDRLTGERATVNNAHLSPPLPRLQAPAPLVPLYLPQPLGGAAALQAPPTALSPLQCRSRTLARLSVVPTHAL